MSLVGVGMPAFTAQSISYTLPYAGYTTAVEGSVKLVPKGASAGMAISQEFCVRTFHAGDKVVLDPKAKLTVCFAHHKTHTNLIAGKDGVKSSNAESFGNCDIQDSVLKKQRQDYQVAATPGNRGGAVLLFPFTGETISPRFSAFAMTSEAKTERTFKFATETDALEMRLPQEDPVGAGQGLGAFGGQFVKVTEGPSSWEWKVGAEDQAIATELQKADASAITLAPPDREAAKLIREAAVFRDHKVYSREALCWAEVAVLSGGDASAIEKYAAVVPAPEIRKEIDKIVGLEETPPMSSIATESR